MADTPTATVPLFLELLTDDAITALAWFEDRVSGTGHVNLDYSDLRKALRWNANRAHSAVGLLTLVGVLDPHLGGTHLPHIARGEPRITPKDHAMH